MGHNIQKCCLKYGDLVKFSYNAPEKETGSTVELGTSNAFETMMIAATNLPQYKKVQTHYPVKYSDPKRNDWKMFNYLIDILKDKGIGFTTVMSAQKRKSYLMTFVSLLFYLNPKKHQSLLKERGYLKVAEI